ncbi:hypothetical protein CW304_14735 [Bacillus sp. UFRGS-B20]|nr:hypothetical protein CW304_14735 [Bacillus sp. UFRGS-B20]
MLIFSFFFFIQIQDNEKADSFLIGLLNSSMYCFTLWNPRSSSTFSLGQYYFSIFQRKITFHRYLFDFSSLK